MEKEAKQLRKLLEKAVRKSLPEGQKIGVLFSGGVDSGTIALLAKGAGADVVCYTASVAHGNFRRPEDEEYAEKVAKEMGLELRNVKIEFNEIENYLEKVANVLETSDVVDIGVGLAIYAALEQAKEEGMEIVLSGQGSDELFAGYSRLMAGPGLNKECESALGKLRQHDSVRDAKIAEEIGVELRNPFLDEAVVEYGLGVPPEMKIKGEIRKLILREVAMGLGLPKELAMRKKKAAQYGSNFDRALAKLAKQGGEKTKSAYLRKFYGRPIMKLGALFSSGKDSTYAAWILTKQNYEISCLINLKSENPHSYMFHTPNQNMVKLQAEAMGIPLVQGTTKGEKEKELEDLKSVIEKAKKEFKIEGLVTGALFSSYQKERIEKICGELGLRSFSPLWHKPQAAYMEELLNAGVEFVFGSVAAKGLDRGWLGKTITKKEIDRLVELEKKYGINVAGEGGEFESLVLDAPLFGKKIAVKKAEIIEVSEDEAQWVVREAELKEKE